MKNIRLFLGASSIIARKMAETYAARGDDLILAGRDIEDVKRTASHLKIQFKVEVSAVQYNACDFDTHQQFIQEITDLSKEHHLHIIALSAINHPQPDLDNNVEKIYECVNSGFTGLISVIHPLASLLETRNNGSIIFFGSVAGDRGRIGNYIYGATKAALHCYSSGLRNRLGRYNIHVTTVKSGLIDTAMLRGRKVPKLLVVKPSKVAKNVIHAHDKKRNIIYTPCFWRLIMLIVRAIPEFIFKKLSF